MVQKYNLLLHEKITPAGAFATKLIAINSAPFEDILNTYAGDHEMASMERFQVDIQLQINDYLDSGIINGNPAEVFLILLASSLVPSAQESNTAYASVDDAMDALVTNEYTLHVLDRKPLRTVSWLYKMTETEGCVSYAQRLRGTYKVPKRFKKDRILFSSDEDLDEVGAQSKCYLLITGPASGFGANSRIDIAGFQDIWYNVREKKITNLTD